MQIAFIAVCLVAAWIFWRRKRVDPMLLGFVACSFYFAPALSGRIEFGEMNNVYIADVASGAYSVLIVVMLVMIGAIWLVDRTPACPALTLPIRYVPHVLLVMTLCAAVISAFTVGWAYFCVKQAMMLSIDHWYYIAAYCAPLCLVAAVAERAWSVAIVAAAVLLLDSFIGFRAGLAIACMAMAVIYGESVLSTGWKSLVGLAIATLVGGLLFVGVREVMIQAKYPFAALCVARAPQAVSIPAAPDALPRTQAGQPIAEAPKPPPSLNLWLVMMSEPSLIQATLNEVVRQRLTVSGDHLIQQAKSAVPGAWLIFGIDVKAAVTFNLLYQPVLFPSIVSGMANNPWAQAYATGGLPVVALFALGYATGLGVLTMLFRMTHGALQAMVAVLAAWWGFYSHRNDLMTEVGIIKMVLYAAVAALIIGWLLGRLRARERKLAPNDSITA
jgi:hypothetical protein